MPVVTSDLQNALLSVQNAFQGAQTALDDDVAKKAALASATAAEAASAAAYAKARSDLTSFLAHLNDLQSTITPSSAPPPAASPPAP